MSTATIVCPTCDGKGAYVSGYYEPEEVPCATCGGACRLTGELSGVAAASRPISTAPEGLLPTADDVLGIMSDDEVTRFIAHHSRQSVVPTRIAHEAVAKVRAALATQSRGLDVTRLTTVLYDWVPDGADVSDPDRDGHGLHLTGGDLARFIFARAAEYARLAPTQAPETEGPVRPPEGERP